MSRVTAFHVETSTDEGATWDRVTRDWDMYTHETVTVTGDALVRVIAAEGSTEGAPTTPVRPVGS